MYDILALHDEIIHTLAVEHAKRWGYTETLVHDADLDAYVIAQMSDTNVQADVQFVLRQVAAKFDLERCTSEFCAPGSDQVRRCEGRAGHSGTVMHAGDGAAWGDDAGIENHPAERIMIRLSRVHNQLRHALATACVLRDQGEELIEILDERDKDIAWLNTCLDEAARQTGADFRDTTPRVNTKAAMNETPAETRTNEHDQGKLG
jgi:hypothetical protein